MDKREQVLKEVKSEYRELAVKIIDQIALAQRYSEPRYTFFLDPSEVEVAKKILDKYPDVGYTVSSGFPDSERNIIAIYPEFMSEENVNLPVVALSISGSSKFEKMSHKDVLGSLMSLGVKREKIGDIYDNEGKFYFICYEDISSYIVANLIKIKHTPVKVEYIDFDKLPLKSIRFKEVTKTVSSLRLDAVISAGFNESRSSISREIGRGNVKVNWEVITNMSYNVSVGDTISVRGRGRIVLDRVEGQTKKGRISISIKRII